MRGSAKKRLLVELTEIASTTFFSKQLSRKESQREAEVFDELDAQFRNSSLRNLGLTVRGSAKKRLLVERSEIARSEEHTSELQSRV